MNKSFDQRVVPDGEYISATNIRMASTEKSEAGVIENTDGNLQLTSIEYNGMPLSAYAKCIGAIDDSARETVYWFLHDPQFPTSNTGKLDMIVSYNVSNQILTYHVISVDDGGGINTTLNFNPQYLITGVNMVEDLLYWTDNYNQPRTININRSYATPDVSGIDYAGIPDLLAETILVIKRPPTSSPTLTLVKLLDESNFLESRFICFAYRYRYVDNQYSATSQWTEIAFSPGVFNFSPESYLNEGMENTYNGANVFFNTGGPLVIGIDLLFKEATGNIIKVIEKFNKQDVGWADNSIQSYLFSNSKIYTILPDSELLRLYDNVPRLAKAQTIMGNRLMYGNYVDGYNLVDSNGSPTKFNYTADLISEEFNITELTTAVSAGNYTIETPLSVPDSILEIDLGNVDLKDGYVLSITTLFKAVDNTLSPISNIDNFSINFFFPLNKSYSSVYQLATSPEFQSFIGTLANIKPVYNPIPGGDNSCDGITVTDKINCLYQAVILDLFDVYVKFECGITGPNEPIKIIANPLSNIIKLQFLATRYSLIPAFTNNIYAYYQIIDSSALMTYGGSTQSLHSNRDYEIGIVYMDEFNRSTPANVSQFNNIHIPCSSSVFKNTITVTIPTSQVAPYWAKRYKFVCKADQDSYDTIYSNIWFLNLLDGNTYFLLQGENARKAEPGSRFVVKSDSSGAVDSCLYATVLDKQSYAEGDIVQSPDNPPGVYMSINADKLNTEKTEDAVVSRGVEEDTKRGSISNLCPLVEYIINIEGTDPLHPTWLYVDYTVPAGSVINMKIVIDRRGNSFGSCGDIKYVYDKTFISTSDYDNMEDWFIGDNIAQTINDGTFTSGTATNLFTTIPFPSCSYFTPIIYWGIERNGVTNQLSLVIGGLPNCPGANVIGIPIPGPKSIVSVDITVYRATDIIIFETEPIDTVPDIFFENELSFPIDVDGNHLSNGGFGDQSQDIALGIPAIIQTGFFNCFSFGNGAESYKIRDSIAERSFNLGNRVTAVESRNYKETRRFSDITYSGNYNPFTNFNNLNVFNPGLVNFKNLEVSFGEVQILDGRETDVLVLQEDKISYVLAGKNLLSDSAAGSAITSVPEVLGTQIARVEKYGISFNPESYVQWGPNRYFTDAKRGAVLQILGTASSNDQLLVISENNMRTWFRDQFITTFNKQKLGGFDPYSNEYVLTSNDVKIPMPVVCGKCGQPRTLTFTPGAEVTEIYESCTDLGNLIGEVFIDFTVLSIDIGTVFSVFAEYDGIIYSSGPQTASGQISFFKNTQLPNNASITLEVTGNAVISLTVACPYQIPMKLVEVVLTNNADAGLATMKQSNYVNGTYVSPLQSNFFIFGSWTGNPPVSFYLLTNGFEGQGPIPVSGSNMTLNINETFPFVSYSFNTAKNKFRYLRTTVLYGNNDADMQTMLALSTEATPIYSPIANIYAADFIVPSDIFGEYLYIIWDLRESYESTLCYAENIFDVCCDCAPCEEECSYYFFENPITNDDNAVVLLPLGLCGSPEATEQIILPGESYNFCLPNVKDNYIISSGNPIIYMQDCVCPL